MLLLAILALLGGVGGVLHPPAAPAVQPSGGLLYELLRSGGRMLWGSSALAWALTAAVAHFSVGLYLTAILIKHRLLQPPVYAPLGLYLAFVLLLPGRGAFGPSLCAAGPLLALLDSVAACGRTAGRRPVFNAGFWAAVAVLIFPPLLWCVLIVPLGVGLLRTPDGRDWAVATLGVIIPLYFLAGGLYLTDRLPLLLAGNFFPKPMPPHLNLHSAGAVLSVVAPAVSVGVGVWARARSTTAVSATVRRTWLVVYTAVALATGAAAAGFGGRDAWLPALLLLAALAAAAYGGKGVWRVATFAFYLLAGMVVTRLLLYS